MLQLRVATFNNNRADVNFLARKKSTASIIKLHPAERMIKGRRLKRTSGREG